MHADLLLRGGAVHSLDAARTGARSIAIAAGRILALDDGDLADLRGPHTRIIDLGPDAAIVPGFTDAHIHFGNYALSRGRVDLDRAATLAEALQVLRAVAERLPAEAWVHGRGWDRNRWGRLPTAADLDTAVGERPAALSSHDGHALWLSSRALRLAGIGVETPSPAGGVIERDEHGQPTGVVFENAQDLARAAIPVPSVDELRTAIAAALPSAAAAGLTGIHNLEDSRSLRAFQLLEASGELTLRVYHGVPRGTLRKPAAERPRTGAVLVGGAEPPAERHAEHTDGLVRIGPVKLFADGALGSRTAHLLEPYEGCLDSGYRGVATLAPEELVSEMCVAAESRLDVAVHAIGDAAVRSVLDAVERARARCPAFHERLVRIEHAQLVHPQDVPRFKHLGVVASMQPIHAIADWRAADAHWGARSRHGYAWRSLLDAGATLAFGTDAPVERPEPLASLHAAVTRIDPDGQPPGGWHPEQRLGLIEAVRAYTTGSAQAERAGQRRGSLSPGKDADLVVLRPDPFRLAPADLPDGLKAVRIEMTIVGGRIVHGGAAELE